MEVGQAAVKEAQKETNGRSAGGSKNQPMVTLLCETEYVGKTQATKEAIWLQQLGEFLNRKERLANAIIFGHKQEATQLARNPQFHAQTKHIDIHHYFLREAQMNGVPSHL